MKYALFIIFIFSSLLNAEELKLSVGKTHYLFTTGGASFGPYIFLEKSCWNQANQCQAYSSLKKKKWSDFVARESSEGGKNPASIFCREAVDGEVVLAKDRSGNTYSLCLFKDNSVVLTDSLLYSSKH